MPDGVDPLSRTAAEVSGEADVPKLPWMLTTPSCTNAPFWNTTPSNVGPTWSTYRSRLQRSKLPVALTCAPVAVTPELTSKTIPAVQFTAKTWP